MSIKLDPRTNDPIIDENGKLVLETDSKKIAAQAFNVWMNTGITTDPMDLEFGFDVRSVFNSPYAIRFGIERAIEVEMSRMISQMPEIFESVMIESVTIEDREVTVRLRVYTTDEQSENLEFTL